MRTGIFYKGLFLVLCLSLFSFDCSNDDGPDRIEGDEDAPIISVVNPDEGDVFYTDGGVETPDYIIIEANASDTSTITIGSATVYNSTNDIVYYYDETSQTQNNTSITTIYTSFRTLHPGNYVVVIEFIDANGNSSSVIRNVTCLFSEGEGTD
ncbi:hypothetical protein AB9K26_05635 [Psychroserpens sp. XS_ASV72]|uniref:hypothetical protein n=1 Tax=Psychroserpens sp. XS_ASV72 TaxID=3241293 RepID=UPI00351622A5